MAEYVKREDVQNILCEMCPGGELCDKTGLCKAKTLLTSIPSADVQPVKRGEWLGEADGYADGELVYDTWYCSCCDYSVEGDEPPEWKYCPNCGARMEGEA